MCLNIGMIAKGKHLYVYEIFHNQGLICLKNCTNRWDGLFFNFLNKLFILSKKQLRRLFQLQVFNITSYHCWPFVFKNNTHRGSDFDPYVFIQRLSQKYSAPPLWPHWAAISWAEKRKKWVSQWSGAFNKRTPSLGFPQGSAATTLCSLQARVWSWSGNSDPESFTWSSQKKDKEKEKAHAFLMKHLNS